MLFVGQGAVVVPFQRERKIEEGFLFLLFSYLLSISLSTRACRRLSRGTIRYIKGSDLMRTRSLLGRTLGLRPGGTRGTLLFSGLNLMRHGLKHCGSTIRSCACTLGVTPLTMPVLLGHTTVCLRRNVRSGTCISCYRIVSMSGGGARTLLVETCVCVLQQSCGNTHLSCRHLLRVSPGGCGKHLKLTALRRGRGGFHRTLSVLGRLLIRFPRSTILCITHTSIRQSVGRSSLTLISLSRTVHLTPSSVSTCLLQNSVCLSRGGGSLTGTSFRGTVSLKIPPTSIRRRVRRYGWSKGVEILGLSFYC